MDDEARAELWRSNNRARIQWERDNAITVRGSVEAHVAVKAAWQPIVDWHHERYQVDPLPPEYHDRIRWTPE